MSNPAVSNEIAAQLGGFNRIRLMTGTKEFVYDDKSLRMKIGKNPKNITHVKITLDPSDEYTVEFMKWNGRKLEMKVVSKREGVYNNMLKDVFYEGTGLYLSFR